MADIQVYVYWHCLPRLYLHFRCLSTGQCLNTLRGHQGRVLCLHVSVIAGEMSLLSGSSDKTIKVTLSIQVLRYKASGEVIRQVVVFSRRFTSLNTQKFIIHPNLVNK